MRVDIKVTPLLFCCSIFSTVVSFMGGLVLYLESIQAVEETVEEIAMSESKAASLILKQAIEEAKRAGDRQSSLMNVWQPFETSTEILEWHLSDAFSLINSSQLYGTGIIVIFNYTQRNPDDHSNISGIYSSVWWDPLTHADWIKSNGGERSYTTSSTYGSQKGIPCVEGEVTPDYCTVGMRLDASTGKIAEPAYNYTGTAVFETWLPGGDALQLLPPGWQHQRVSRWRGVQSWISPDRTMYDYVEYVAVAPLLKSASSLLNDAFVVSRSWIYFGAWTDLLISMQFESSLFVVAGDLLLAANDRKAMERKCGWNENGDPDLWRIYSYAVHPCAVLVSDQVPAVATAIRTLSTARDARFMRQSLSGGDYWMLRRTVLAPGLHDDIAEVFLAWMKPVSSVEDKMIRALLFFVGFIGVVIVFDTFVVTLEILKIGRPLSALTKAVKHVDRMDLSSAVEELDRHNINKAGFSVKDIRMLYVSFRETINSLKGYKASMPLNALPGGAAGGMGTKGVTMEEPQFVRLHSLFITLLDQASLGPLNELLTQLKFPEGVDKTELLLERAKLLEDRSEAPTSLGVVERLVLYIYTMEGTDIDRFVGFDDAPEWMELEQFGTEGERREALELWELGGDAAVAAAGGKVEGVRMLVEKLRGGLLTKIKEAQAAYREYKDRIGGSRNADLYKVLCASLRTIQNAEGSVTDFVGSLQKLISQGFINFIAVLCCTVTRVENVAGTIPMSPPPVGGQVQYGPSVLEDGAATVHCWRGLNKLSPETVMEQSRLRKGQFVGWVAPASVTTKENVALRFVKERKTSVLMELRGLTHCIQLQQLSMYPQEEELLVPPFSTWEVEAVGEEEGLVRVTLRYT
eukprot:Hpha_TRINITY_DN16937_c0_g1::TRINITY_DN16937_c0_g1_i2::g.53017::m.53017